MKRKRTIKTLAVFDAGGKPVKAWLAKQESEICFRMKGSRKVNRISVRDIYEGLVGQLKMPFL